MLVGPMQYIKKFYNLNNLSMMVFNIVIIIMHARQDASLKVLSMMAAISSIHLGLNIFMWMRIFENTAIYVMLIVETVKDLRQFILIFLVVVGAFGVCIAVINRYQMFDDNLCYDMLQDFDN
jgi:spore maturation protein CgeB